MNYNSKLCHMNVMYQAICTHSPQQQPTILNICNYWLLHWWDTKVSNSCNTSPNIISELQSVQFSCSVVSNSLWPHGRTPGFPVHHQLPELVQTHVHWVSDAIQPSHSLSSPSAPAFNLSQHQGLFQWVSSSNQVAKILELQLQHQSFQWIFRTDLL